MHIKETPQSKIMKKIIPIIIILSYMTQSALAQNDFELSPVTLVYSVKDHFAAAYDDKLWVLGGYDSSQDNYNTGLDQTSLPLSSGFSWTEYDGTLPGGTLFLYDEQDTSWNIDDKIYMINPGLSTGSSRHAMYVYSLTSRSFITKDTPPLETWCACVTYNPLDDIIYSIGGFGGPTYFTYVQRYDVAGDQWLAAASDLKIERSHNGCAVSSDGILYTFGGYNNGGFLNSIERYSNDEWTTIAATLKVKRNNVKCRTLTGLDRILCVGGYSGSYETAVDTFQPSTETMLSTTTSLKEGRRFFTMTLWNNGQCIVVTGGWTTGSSQINSIETYGACTGLPVTSNPTTTSPTQKPTEPPTRAPTTLPTTSTTTNSPTQAPTASLPTADAAPTDGHTSYSTSESTLRSPTNKRDGIVMESTYHPSISPMTVNTNMPPESVNVLLIAVIVISFIAIIVLRRHCLKQEKKITEQRMEDINNVDKMHRDDSMGNDDPIEMGYTVEGPRDNPDDVIKTYTHEGPQGNVSRVSTEKIWNKELRVVNALHATPNTETDHHQNHKDMLEVQTWLHKEVELHQYLDVLITNGYESMQIIKDISNKAELEEIGIESKQHQMILMEEIQKWKEKHMGTIQGQTYEGSPNNGNHTKSDRRQHRNIVAQDKKIWNNEVQLVNMSYRTQNAEVIQTNPYGSLEPQLIPKVVLMETPTTIGSDVKNNRITLMGCTDCTDGETNLTPKHAETLMGFNHTTGT
eukprot:835957_1